MYAWERGFLRQRGLETGFSASASGFCVAASTSLLSKAPRSTETQQMQLEHANACLNEAGFAQMLAENGENA